MKLICSNPYVPVVYEDNHLLVIDKPHNLLSQGDHTGDPDLLTLCREYLRNEKNKSGNIYLGLVHRLDRPVGGLMLLAKSSRAAAGLSEQIRNQTIQKTYRVVVEGTPPVNGVLTHHLVKNRASNIVETASPDNPEAKQAVLSFIKERQAGPLSLLSVHLQTGRPHQIRIQLAAGGYPVWGDYKYGRQQPDGRLIALRAAGLVFEHPTTREETHFSLPDPDREPWNLFGR